MSLPKQYAWLGKLTSPRLIVEFAKIFGVKEVPGTKSNPEILRWAKVVSLDKVYTNDGIAWCGLTMAYLCHMCEKPFVDAPLWALSWANWGVMVKPGQEMLGDVLVFKRFNSAGKLIGGHVGLYIGENKTHFFVGGGNEGDMVQVVLIAKNRLHACRRPIYVNQPKEVKKVFLEIGGALVSNNEA